MGVTVIGSFCRLIFFRPAGIRVIKIAPYSLYAFFPGFSLEKFRKGDFAASYRVVVLVYSNSAVVHGYQPVFIIGFKNINAFQEKVYRITQPGYRFVFLGLEFNFMKRFQVETCVLG